MDYHLVLAILSLFFVIVSFILMQVSKRRFTEGYFRSYMNLVVISGTFMAIYLLASLTSKLELQVLSNFNWIIKAIGYISEILAAIIFIRSSILLDKMAKKYSFKEKTFFKQFQS